MSYQEVLEQTKTLTKEQKQSLAYFLLFSTISEEQRKEYENLLHYKKDKKIEQKKDIGKILDKYIGTVKNVWNEDAQIYINKLREDDREF